MVRGWMSPMCAPSLPGGSIIGSAACGAKPISCRRLRKQVRRQRVWYIRRSVIPRLLSSVAVTVAAAVALVVATDASAISPSFEQGEDLFLHDRPLEAQPLLQQAILEDPANELAYLYLGVAYEQLEEHAKAVDVLQKGIALHGDHQGQMYLNVGNNMFAQSSFLMATEMYGKALSADPTLVNAYLNRANARLQAAEFDSALADYTLYLSLDPGSSQRTQIEQVIALLRQRIELVAEQERQEQERQTALLNAVLTSLDNAAQNTKNLSAGSEGIQEQYDELDIAD